MKHVHIYFEISIQIYSERIKKINQIPNFQYYTRQFSKESYLVSIDYIFNPNCQKGLPFEWKKNQ